MSAEEEAVIEVKSGYGLGRGAGLVMQLADLAVWSGSHPAGLAVSHRLHARIQGGLRLALC